MSRAVVVEGWTSMDSMSPRAMVPNASDRGSQLAATGFRRDQLQHRELRVLHIPQQVWLTPRLE